MSICEQVEGRERGHHRSLGHHQRAGVRPRGQRLRSSSSRFAEAAFAANVVLRCDVADVRLCVCEGHEGRIGMAALKLMEGMEFDRTKTFNHVCRFLPGYARPRFIRIQVEFPRQMIKL